MATVDSIISTAQDIATEQSSNVTNSVNTANGIAAGSTAFYWSTPTLPIPATPDELHVKNHQNFGAYIPESIDPSAIYNNFNSTYNQLYNTAVGALVDFLTTYFPRSQSYDEAELWLEQAISLNGNNFTSVETPMWANARNRILGEHLSLENAAYAQIAGRNMPLPTGTLTAQLQELRIQQSDKLAEISNTAAIKHLDIAVDLIKFAVDTAIKQRQQALALAIDYIRALMQPADIASRLVFQTGNLQAELIRAVGGYYESLLSKDKLLLETALSRAELDYKYSGLMIELNKVDISNRVSAAVGAAGAAAEVAKGAVSALNAIGSITQQS